MYIPADLSLSRKSNSNRIAPAETRGRVRDTALVKRASNTSTINKNVIIAVAVVLGVFVIAVLAFLYKYRRYHWPVPPSSNSGLVEPRRPVFWATKPEGVLDGYESRTPGGKLATMADVVDATQFLLRNRGVSAVNLYVDRGWSIT